MGATQGPRERAEIVYKIAGKAPKKEGGCSYRKENMIDGASSSGKWRIKKVQKRNKSRSFLKINSKIR